MTISSIRALFIKQFWTGQSSDWECIERWSHLIPPLIIQGNHQISRRQSYHQMISWVCLVFCNTCSKMYNLAFQNINHFYQPIRYNQIPTKFNSKFSYEKRNIPPKKKTASSSFTYKGKKVTWLLLFLGGGVN